MLRGIFVRRAGERGQRASLARAPDRTGTGPAAIELPNSARDTLGSLALETLQEKRVDYRWTVFVFVFRLICAVLFEREVRYAYTQSTLPGRN